MYRTTEELAGFYDDDKDYITNGVILVDTDYADAKTPRMSKEVASALRGRPLSAKDRLKLAGTEVLALADSTGTSTSTSTANSGRATHAASARHPAASSATPGAQASAGVVVDLDNLEALLAGSNAMMASFAELEAQNDAELEGSSSSNGGVDDDTSSVGALGDSGDVDGGDVDANDAELKEPYIEELDFLEDQFEMVTAYVRNLYLFFSYLYVYIYIYACVCVCVRACVCLCGWVSG